MDRIPEPELMNGAEQAAAYAAADFADANSLFVELLDRYFPQHVPHNIVDLGCGPGDILARLAREWPGASLAGVDGADAMLAHARAACAEFDARVRLMKIPLQELSLPRHFDTIVSNSLLHHLADPGLLWRRIVELGIPGAPVLVMDLARPDDEAQVRALLQRYADGEPEVLRQDFYHSLRAAYRPQEIEDQLRRAGLEHFVVERPSDRHVVIYGRLAGEQE
jgi:trans-aconitate methyltransferase